MEDQNTIDQSNLKMVRKLGSGCQAEVLEVQDSITHQHYALKVIPIASLNHKQKERAEFEVKSNLMITQQVQSNNFPVMHCYWSTTTSINILFELCQHNAEIGYKTLSSSLQRYNYLLVLLFDMLNALAELEKMSIIHRDIKPENILAKYGIFKLTDLGLSRLSDKQHQSFTNDIGNRLGRSPQFITGNYDYKTDIWSLGVHLFYLLENTLPFDEESLLLIRNNPNDIQKVISSSNLIVDLQASGRRSKNILSFLHLILSEMIVVDPSSRASASQVLLSFFTITPEQVSPIKRLLLMYLRERQDCYLLMLLAYVEFYRMDGKIREEGQSNKRKICLKVKVVLYQVIQMLQSTIHFQQKQTIYLHELSNKWREQLSCEIQSTQIQPLTDIDQVLQLYKIAKVREKFPLIEWIVKLYKVISLKSQGVTTTHIYLWEIPLELHKLI